MPHNEKGRRTKTNRETRRSDVEDAYNKSVKVRGPNKNADSMVSVRGPNKGKKKKNKDASGGTTGGAAIGGGASA